MKTPLLIIAGMLVSLGLHAQTFEFSAHANSGLFHYSGKSTESTTFINGATPGGGPGYTNNPYGSKNGISYGIAVQEQFTSKGGFIVGVQAAYDVLRSTVDIDGVNEPRYQLEYLPMSSFPFTTPGNTPANGESHLTTQFVNLNPYIGYRVKFARAKLDLMPGMDFAFGTSARDKGQATTNGQHVQYKTDEKLDAKTDVRLRFGAALVFGRIGVTASYAHGLMNYERNMLADAPVEAYSNLIRLGLSYRIF